MVVKNWTIYEQTGYQPITTFYTDFSIADWFGVSAIRDTFKRAFAGWKNNYKYLTELVLALNWKIWEHNETNETYAQVYHELWEIADGWAMDNLKGKELSYFLSTTD